MHHRATGAFVLAAALSSSACYTMRTVTFGELGTARPGAVWITKADQSVIVVETPRVFGDTLVGYINGEFQELPNTDMTGFKVKRMAGARTAGLVGATAAAVGVFVVMVTGTDPFFDPQVNLDCDDEPNQVGCPGFIP
jgi:hypothetical protein